MTATLTLALTLTLTLPQVPLVLPAEDVDHRAEAAGESLHCVLQRAPAIGTIYDAEGQPLGHDRFPYVLPLGPGGSLPTLSYAGK